jgi:cytochrome b subunit of formate dehydrogenase
MNQQMQSVVPDAGQANIYLKRIARVSAWLLLAAIIVLLISGWGITRTEIIYKASFGLIDRGAADSIHRAIQVPMAVIFITHVFTNVRLRLPSRCLKKVWLFNSILVTIGVCLLAGVVYMEYFT